MKLSQLEDYKNLDGLILAVSHKEYLEMGQAKLLAHGARRRLLRRREERVLAGQGRPRHPLLELVSAS